MPWIACWEKHFAVEEILGHSLEKVSLGGILACFPLPFTLARWCCRPQFRCFLRATRPEVPGVGCCHLGSGLPLLLPLGSVSFELMLPPACFTEEQPFLMGFTLFPTSMIYCNPNTGGFNLLPRTLSFSHLVFRKEHTAEWL